MLEADVPALENHVGVKGDFAIDGVPTAGTKIELNKADAAGAKTGIPTVLEPTQKLAVSRGAG